MATQVGMSWEELESLPPSVDPPTAFRVVRVGRTKGYEMLRTGTFPARVFRLGNNYRILTADLLELVGVDRRAAVSVDPREAVGA